MALEPLQDLRADLRADLRSTISHALKKVWPNPLPHQDLAQANALREEVAAEIAAKLRSDPSRRDELVRDSFPATDNPGAASEAGALAGTLALGARLKPRGIFEDDWRSRPTPQRPWPIILIHGTCDTKGIWQGMGETLRADGWAVFAPDYGFRATGLIPESAAQLDAYIRAVLQVTGAEKAILVGHSQGGLLARYWMRMFGTAHLVHHVVCIGAPNHGTTQGGIVSPLVTTRRGEEVMASIISTFFGAAGEQQIVGSDILRQVNEGGDLEPGVRYTCIATRSDTVVVPPETCFLDPGSSPDGTVRNLYVQDFDRFAVVLHQDLPMDRRVRVIVSTVLRQIL